MLEVPHTNIHYGLYLFLYLSSYSQSVITNAVIIPTRAEYCFLLLLLFFFVLFCFSGIGVRGGGWGRVKFTVFDVRLSQSANDILAPM